MNNHGQHDALRTVIREFRESINRSNHDAQSMNEEEFSQFVDYIRRRVSIDTTTLREKYWKNFFIIHVIKRNIFEESLKFSPVSPKLEQLLNFLWLLRFSGRSISFLIIDRV